MPSHADLKRIADEPPPPEDADDADAASDAPSEAAEEDAPDPFADEDDATRKAVADPSVVVLGRLDALALGQKEITEQMKIAIARRRAMAIFICSVISFWPSARASRRPRTTTDGSATALRVASSSSANGSGASSSAASDGASLAASASSASSGGGGSSAMRFRSACDGTNAATIVALTY